MHGVDLGRDGHRQRGPLSFKKCETISASAGDRRDRPRRPTGAAKTCPVAAWIKMLAVCRPLPLGPYFAGSVRLTLSWPFASVLIQIFIMPLPLSRLLPARHHDELA